MATCLCLQNIFWDDDITKWTGFKEQLLELSTGPFCVTRCNQTHQLTDPTRPNPMLTVIGLHCHFITHFDQIPVPVRSAIKSHLTARYNQISSNSALNALK